MAFLRKRELPKKSGPSPAEALEKREAEVKQVLEFLDGKRTLDSLGLSLADLRGFAALREHLGPDGLRALAPLLKAMDPGTAKEVSVLLSLGIKPDEAGALRGMAQILKGAGVSSGEMALHMEAAAELARSGLPAGAVKGAAREMVRLRRRGVEPERVAGVLAAYAEQQAGAEAALIEAIRKQKEAEARLASAERQIRNLPEEARVLEEAAEAARRNLEKLADEVESLRREKALLEAEVKGLAPARGVLWSGAVARVHRGLEELRKEHGKAQDALRWLRRETELLGRERAGPAAPAASPQPSATPAGRWSRLAQKMQQASAPEGPEAGAPAIESLAPAAPGPFDFSAGDAAVREVAEALAALAADTDSMLRRREALDAEVRERESELHAAETLWVLLSGRGDPNLLSAAEGLVRAAREGKPAEIPPEFRERLREGARRLLQAETVPAERLREAEREVAELRQRLEASVPRARLDALVKECEELRGKLAEAVPKWRAEAQEHELQFLKRVAFRKGT